ncbi:YmaF family protein [Paenibacillus hodogayensis]|uniref:YmaF family protein n=1 Tax=Paenibacillus hodogayensis TaxID=279208 RepID=A0ABV5W420_9BACL
MPSIQNPGMPLVRQATGKSDILVPAGRTPRPAHAHYAAARSSTELGHWHWIYFFTYPVNGSAADGHVHDYQGTSRVADYKGVSHFHRFNGTTGPAIALADGTHYHLFSAELNDEPFQLEGGSYLTVLSIPRHTHSFSGPTGPGLGYEPPGW